MIGEHTSLTAPAPLVWTTPSKDSSGSMPLGNGDIGLNVWVEEDGDLRFYLSRTDAWDERARLLKLGRVRVSLLPNPFVASAAFRQELDLAHGCIRICGQVTSDPSSVIRFWSNHDKALRQHGINAIVCL